MPAFRISVDDDVMATVNTEGYDMFTVHVNGNRSWECRARVHVAAGRYPAGAPSTYLIFLPDMQLLAGQRVTIALFEDGVTGPAGKTIDELYPDEPRLPETHDFSITDERIAEIAALPVWHDRFAFDYLSSDGTSIAVETPPEDDSFSLTLLWDSLGGADPARVALRSNNILNIQARKFGNVYVEQRLKVGGYVSLTLR
jgi:hypothetical protein